MKQTGTKKPQCAATRTERPRTKTTTQSTLDKIALSRHQQVNNTCVSVWYNSTA